MIETRALTKLFGEKSGIQDLSLRVNPGELFALLGANGAGKTTTMNLLLGFLSPERGEALIDEIVVAKSPDEARRRIAFIPEQVVLYPELSGVENLRFFHQLSTQNLLDNAALEELLVRSGLPRDALHRRASTYSKGMRQKVGIAIARSRGAKNLLLDEPTSGLDPSASAEFSALLTQLKQEGFSILMATHDLFRAQQVATRVGVLREGTLLVDLAASEIKPGDLERIYLEQISR